MAKTISLWRRRGNADAFEALLRPHVPSMYRLAHRLTGNADDAEDLVQELLLRLYPRRDELTGIDRLHPWLARILYRLYVDRGRRRKRWLVSYADLPGVDGDDAESGRTLPDPASEDESGQPETATERAQSRQSLRAALQALSDDHRTVVVLHDVEGMRLDEMQTVLEVPVGTLKSRLHRARARLRELLADGTGSRATACEGANGHETAPAKDGWARTSTADDGFEGLVRKPVDNLSDKRSAGDDEDA